MRIDVVSLDNRKIGDAELSDAVFGAEVRPDILHRMVAYQLNRRRAGTRKARERGEIRGTTAKMYRQKGTGRARHSSRKAGLFRGGGVVHGPRNRSHATRLPKKVRRIAMRSALSAKAAGDRLRVVDSLRAGEARTGKVAAQLEAFGGGSLLLVDGPETDPSFARAVANLPGVDLLPVQGANVYDILRHDTLVLVPEAVRAIEERLA